MRQGCIKCEQSIYLAFYITMNFSNIENGTSYDANGGKITWTSNEFL